MNCERCGQPAEGRLCVRCLEAADHTGRFQVELPVDGDETAVDLRALKPSEAALVVLRGPQAGEVWTLEGPTIEIGRANDSALFLDDITVSRHHALLRLADSSWWLEDLGSLNGTYVNRAQIETAVQLQSGDELQIGKFRFRFFDGAAK